MDNLEQQLNKNVLGNIKIDFSKINNNSILEDEWFPE